MIEDQLDPIMNNFNLKMSKFLMIMSQKNRKMSVSIFKFLLKNIEKNEVFYSLIEIILQKTQSQLFFLEFFEFGAAKMNESPQFGNKFLEVVCKYLVELVHSPEHEAPKSLAVPVNRAFFSVLLRKYHDNPFNFNYERAIVLLIKLFDEGKIFNSFDSKAAIAGAEPVMRDARAAEGPEIARSLLDQLLGRINSKEFNFIHILCFAALHIKAANDAVVQLDIIKTAMSIIETEEKHKLEAHAALQTLMQFDEHYKTLLDRNIDAVLLAILEKSIEQEKFASDEEYVKTFLRSVYLLFARSQERIAVLEERLFQMVKRFQKNRFFVEKILLGFFEFKQIKLTEFVPFAPPVERATTRELPDSKLPGDNSLLFQLESCLGKEKLEILSATARGLIDEKTSDMLGHGTWRKEIETSFETEDFSEAFEQKCYSKNPMLIVCNCDSNGNPIYLIIFAPTGFTKLSAPSQGFVPNSPNCFISVIDGTTHLDYKPAATAEKFLEYKADDPFYKSITFYHEFTEKIKISMSEEVTSLVDLYPLKPLNEPSQDYDFPYEIRINNVEIFLLAASEEQRETSAGKDHFYEQLLRPTSKTNLLNVSHSICARFPVFELPEEITLRGLEAALKTTLSHPDKNKQLGDFSEKLVELKSSKPIYIVEPKDLEDKFNPRNLIFELFLQKGGMNYLINKIIEANLLDMFKSEEVLANWRVLMKTIMRLESLDGFVLGMIQNKEFFAIIFELIVGDPKSTRDWAASEMSISWLILQKLATMLSNNNSLEMRIKFLKLNVLELMLEKIAGLSNEIKRKYCENPEQEEPQPAKEPEKPAKEETYTKEIKKRKGVGYDKEGTGKKWIVTDYLAKKKQRTDFITDILRLFLLIFDRDYPDTPELAPLKATWYNQFCESCFLPLLESAFKCSSLHEMAKDFELYKLYCDVLLTIAARKELQDLLKPVPKNYRPPQIDAVLDILLKQEENTTLFKKFSDNEGTKKEKIESIELADKILKTIAQIKAMYVGYFSALESREEQMSLDVITKINELPLNDRYKLAMNEQRFGLVNMKKKEEYEHHYASSLTSEQKSCSTSRSVRLAQEIADLTASLPIDSYNAIFVRSDENRLDLMKSIIAGAEGTPYANGLFEYHVYLPPEYPSSPPKCNLETTGSGDIRFNPNLYACGKVCLSLLGTWRGNASENWDPKISNLLQLFLSIQSVVMSEEIYFNEPGYEHEAGTEEGEAKNEGYSNIVRMGNIKFAMIGMIKKPPVGFEDIVRRHFYIKHEVIMKEVSSWVKMAEIRHASYSGLVIDHNHKYAQRFSENQKNYLNELKTVIKELETTLKELIAANEITTIYSSKRHKKAVKANREKHKKQTVNENDDKLKEKIDVTYDADQKQQVFDAEDSKVADRWSRYIGVLGIDAVRKQTKASVVLFGLSAVGLEIAKNLVLSGLKRLDIFDWKKLDQQDLSTNFYAEQSQLGANRATAVLNKLKQLNPYVQIDASEIEGQFDTARLAEFDVVVVCDNYLPVTRPVIEAAGQMKKKVVISETNGIFSRIFCDFGDEFEVLDRDGEEPAECFIKEVDYEKNTIVLLEKSNHLLRAGDVVQLIEVVSAPDEKKKPLDKAVLTIKDVNKISELSVAEDLKEYQSFERNGKVREIKVPQKLKFRRYDSDNVALIDPNLAVFDFAKMEYPAVIAKCYELKEKFEEKHKRPLSTISREEYNQLSKDIAKIPQEEPKPAQPAPSETHSVQASDKDSQTPTETEKATTAKEESQNVPDQKAPDHAEIKEQKTATDAKETPKLPLELVKLRHMLMGSLGAVHCVAAFTGGVAAQEIIKCITNKYIPIVQGLYCDFEELLDERISSASDDEFWSIFATAQTEVTQSRTNYLRVILGQQTFEQVVDARLFMVGAGAIGCELLKNLSFAYFGSRKGELTLTDPDNIELSNLSRQFLFREKHISKPKALVAARVIESMNPEYAPGTIKARLEKVCDETEQTFSNEFFKSQSLCLNALDNVRARVYMDQRCVRNSVPLLESGTLGPKCHLQVIIPFLTENYGSVQDAKEEQSIPICTLKMFPEEPIHCMEWAKDKFEEFFNQNPRNLLRLLEEFKKTGNFDAVDFKIVKRSLKFLKTRPSSAQDCVAIARKWFQKFFHNNLRQLLSVYPLDFKGKDGKLFWTLPKRPPTPLVFDVNDSNHMGMIKAAVKLLMSVWSMDPQLAKDLDWKTAVESVKVEPFVARAEALESIKKSVEKNEKDAKV